MSNQKDVISSRSSPEAEHSVPFTHPVVFFPYLVLILGNISLVGWVLHIPLLTSALPHFSTMKPNTALSLGLLAVCCRARSRQRNTSGRWGTVSACCLGVALALSCGTIIEYASGKDLGIDNLILSVPLGRFDDSAGRMALGTAVCVALSGCALALVDRAPRLSVWMLLTANLIALSALLVFILNGGPLANIPWLRSMAVPTALSLLMLSVAALALQPHRQPIRGLLESVSRERRVHRRFIIFIVLPLLVAIPSVVALRGDIPEAFATLIIVGILLYSAQTWNSYRQSRMRETLKPITDPK